MKKLDLNEAAEEFDMIGFSDRIFYNKETGEFGHYRYDADEMEDMDDTDADHEYDGCERFRGSQWVALPEQYEINEYEMMTDFAGNLTDPKANELLCVALEGKGAFRRFRDTLQRVGLADEWYAFKHRALVEIAREWCKDNDIQYEDTASDP